MTCIISGRALAGPGRCGGCWAPRGLRGYTERDPTPSSHI